MLVSDITSGGAFPMLEKMLAFTEARNRMVAENIANVTTPGYQAKQLDMGGFQAALKAAAQRQAEQKGAFRMEETRQFRQDDLGLLHVTPTREPVENLLFHDGTNARIERQMALLAENTMINQIATELLKGYYDGTVKAIRGRVT